MPEAKTYRFLADILNDTAIVLDTLSPFLASLPLLISLPEVIPIPFRVYTLCLSSSLRALCGISAGGSKTAISLHFATPLEGTGNIGDLNAKDSSKETVLGLVGMLLGTVVVPYLTTPFSTYSTLFLLVGLHLGFNFAAVRGVKLRTLNRQRTSLAWCGYQGSVDNGNAQAPSPSEIAGIESIFHEPSTLRDDSGNLLGHCTIGSSIGVILSKSSTSLVSSTVLDALKDERYILWFDPGCLSSLSTAGSIVSSTPRLHIFLRDGHRPSDHLKAWIHATEVARLVRRELLAQRRRLASHVDDALHNTSGNLELDLNSKTLDPTNVIVGAYEVVGRELPSFTDAMIQATWTFSNVDGSKELDVALMTGPPITVITQVIEDVGAPHEESRKER
ncbi:hypothetical protein PQX77_005211 [Marasmius sp. AFHP31]|nr:hypothetical protein PQX77_005211 [Marasmius sp. AFHP31]